MIEKGNNMELILKREQAIEEYNQYEAEILAKLTQLQAMVSQHAEWHGSDPRWSHLEQMRDLYNGLESLSREFGE